MAALPIHPVILLIVGYNALKSISNDPQPLPIQFMRHNIQLVKLKSCCKELAAQLLPSLAVSNDARLDEVKEALVVSSVLVDDEDEPSVHTHSLLLFLLPATGVSGQESLSDSEDESLLSPVCGDFVLDLIRSGTRGGRRTVPSENDVLSALTTGRNSDGSTSRSSDVCTSSWLSSDSM